MNDTDFIKHLEELIEENGFVNAALEAINDPDQKNNAAIKAAMFESRLVGTGKYSRFFNKNGNVRLEKNPNYETNVNVRKTNITSIIVAMTSAALVLASVILQFHDTTPTELQGIIQRQQKTEEILQSIESSLQKINSSIQNQRKDTAIIQVLRQTR
jgi:hypothetical protein